jgi:hypothetical protein
MITLRRAIGITAPSADARAEAAALGTFTLLVYQQFRPRLDRLPIFSTHALAAIDVLMLIIMGGRDAMLDSNETKQRLAEAGKTVRLLPGAGHLLPDQTQPILPLLRG